MDSTAPPTRDYKMKEVLSDEGGGAFKQYRRIQYGDTSLAFVLACELVTTLFGWIPGALGLGLRGLFYRFMFVDRRGKVIIGRNVTLRHPRKIRILGKVILDDNSVLDAKGETNEGITLGDGVYIGRNTIVYCKNGDIVLGDRVNFSSNCQVFSSNKLVMGPDTVVGAFTYLLSGGEYDADDPTPFAKQTGMNTKGPLEIGPNCWLAARVTVLDGASVGEHCVLGAGTIVTKPVPPHSVAVGIPAKVVKSLPVEEK